MWRRYVRSGRVGLFTQLESRIQRDSQTTQKSQESRTQPIDSPDSFTSLWKVLNQKADGDSWILVSLHKALTTQCVCVWVDGGGVLGLLGLEGGDTMERRGLRQELPVVPRRQLLTVAENIGLSENADDTVCDTMCSKRTNTHTCARTHTLVPSSLRTTE